jgi:hypothetical protein
MLSSLLPVKRVNLFFPNLIAKPPQILEFSALQKPFTRAPATPPYQAREYQKNCGQIDHARLPPG